MWPFQRERRSQSARTSDPYLAQMLGARSPVGTAVSPDAVLSNLAVAARCVALRAELLASVGLFLFRRTATGGRDRAVEASLYEVLHGVMNPNMTAFEGREFLIRSLDLAGNAYARVERDGRGQVTALYPLVSSSVTVERLASDRLRYRVAERAGVATVLLQEEILHIRGPSRDGLIGMSPIQIARGALGLALNQTEIATGLMANSMRPSGLVTYPEKLAPDSRKAAREALEAHMAGPTNAGRLMLVDGGAKFERVTFTPEDAEFLDSRKLANEDVARIFGLPPTSVGITDKATYSNTEQEARALVQNALGPLAARVESAMGRCLLTPESRRSLYIEHDLAALLRGDVAARFEAYRIGREIGALSANDVRRRENEPPIPGGDAYHMPSNWQSLSEGVAPPPMGGRS